MDDSLKVEDANVSVFNPVGHGDLREVNVYLELVPRVIRCAAVESFVVVVILHPIYPARKYHRPHLEPEFSTSSSSQDTIERHNAG